MKILIHEKADTNRRTDLKARASGWTAAVGNEEAVFFHATDWQNDAEFRARVTSCLKGETVALVVVYSGDTPPFDNVALPIQVPRHDVHCTPTALSPEMARLTQAVAAATTREAAWRAVQSRDPLVEMLARVTIAKGVSDLAFAGFRNPDYWLEHFGTIPEALRAASSKAHPQCDLSRDES